MQIPQNIMNTLSAKGKGYVEATLKLAEGHRLIAEATIEMAHLDGKKINPHSRKLNKNGGEIVTSQVRDLAKPKVTAEYLKAFLKETPRKTTELAKLADCSDTLVRKLLDKDHGTHLVGTGNQVRWSLTPETSKIKRTRKAKTRATTAPKTVRKTKTKASRAKMSPTARRQANSEAADPALQKADEDKIVKILEDKGQASISTFMKTLRRSYYPVARALKALSAAKRVHEVTMKRANGGSYAGWELTPGGA